MAIYHLELHRVKSPTASISTAGRHNAAEFGKYVRREGKWKERAAELVYSESGNLPAFCAGRPQSYWRATDRHERKNACLGMAFDIALPVEATLQEQIALAREFTQAITTVKGGTLPYEMAIHTNPTNPHFHILMSERVNDGIDRPTDKWFKRASPKNPHDGGAKKDPTLQKKEWLFATRQKWESHLNAFLKSKNLPLVSCKTLAAQGIDRKPQIHKTPAVAAMERRGLKTRLGEEWQTRKDLIEAEEHEKQLANIVARFEALVQEREAEEARKPAPAITAESVKRPNVPFPQKEEEEEAAGIPAASPRGEERSIKKQAETPRQKPGLWQQLAMDAERDLARPEPQPKQYVSPDIMPDLDTPNSITRNDSALDLWPKPMDIPGYTRHKARDGYTYSNDRGRIAMVDHGHDIKITIPDDETITQALTHGAERWPQIRITGTPEFQARAMAIAQKLNLANRVITVSQMEAAKERKRQAELELAQREEAKRREDFLAALADTRDKILANRQDMAKAYGLKSNIPDEAISEYVDESIEKYDQATKDKDTIAKDQTEILTKLLGNELQTARNARAYFQEFGRFQKWLHEAVDEWYLTPGNTINVPDRDDSGRVKLDNAGIPVMKKGTALEVKQNWEAIWHAKANQEGGSAINATKSLSRDFEDMLTRARERARSLSMTM